MASQYSVVSADLVKDQETILDVWRRNLSSVEKLEEKYRWHFQANPYGPGLCWMLLADGRPAGTACVGMRMLQIRSKVEPIGVSCDLAVDKEHRFLLPALKLQKALTAAVGAGSGLRIVYGLPNHNGAATVRRIGYREAGEVHRHVRVLRVAPYLERRAGGVAGRAAGAVADLAYSAWMRAVERLRGGYVVETNTGFDGRFDALWAGRRKDFPIAIVRDSRYLQWRFGHCPLRKYSTVGVFNADRERLAGYAVQYLEGENMILADFLTSSKAEDANALITAALIHARKARACSLSLSLPCSMPRDLLTIFAQRGFRQRTDSPSKDSKSRDNGIASKGRQAGRMLLVYSELDSEPAVTDPWYFTAGDEPYN
jgi:hypothetical protein